MGTLEILQTGTEFVLEAHNLLGRSPHCSLILSSEYVSNEHASIDWIDNGWYVRDLGTTNGTFVDGSVVQPRGQTKVRVGAVISIGESEECLKLVDPSPPCPMIVSVNDRGRDVRQMEHGTIVLPSSDNPELSVYEEKDGTWALERDGSKSTIMPGAYFSAYDNTWRLSVPQDKSSTALNRGQLLLENADITFYVSDDEETVELCIRAGHEEIWMPNRSYHYMLLTLARERMNADEDGGWLQRELIERMLKADEYTVNVWIYRTRKQFSSAGFLRPAEVVERRNGALRIGGRSFTVKPLRAPSSK